LGFTVQIFKRLYLRKHAASFVETCTTYIDYMAHPLISLLSVAEYCCSVWLGSCHSSLKYSQFRSATLQSRISTHSSPMATSSHQYPLLIDLENCKRQLLSTEVHSKRPVRIDVVDLSSTACVSISNMVRHDPRNCSVKCRED